MKYFVKTAVSTKLVERAAANRFTMQKHLQKAVDKGSHKIPVTKVPKTRLDPSQYVGKNKRTVMVKSPTR